ncbi:hypothetical protein Plhal304r1_c003g0013511 [Plasmopara halstedii]
MLPSSYKYPSSTLEKEYPRFVLLTNWRASNSVYKIGYYTMREMVINS